MITVDVFGKEYEIREKCTDIKDGEDGSCDPHKRIIKLRKTIRDKETLSHEVGHAILFEAGLYCALDEKLREVIVQQFAQVFALNFNLKLKK